jgi:uncharacterized protein YifE (UPF0438 family)
MGKPFFVDSISITKKAGSTAMADIPPDNQEPRSFHFGCSTDIFPMEELSALQQRGHLLEALAAGTIPPSTTEQEHFLLVDREETEPVTVDERAWVRLKGRREFEQESTPPPVPREDYGIIEWDREKCWW